MTGSGFQSPVEEGDDDHSLSHEACYECKINGAGGGGGKTKRHRRNAEENELNQVTVMSNRFSVLISIGVKIQKCVTFLLPRLNTSHSFCPFSSLQEPAVSMASIDTEASIPMNLSLSSLHNKEPLLELLPALQPLEHHVRYVITHGNANEHFRLLERRDGKSVLRLGKRSPPAGSYRLEIASLRLFGPRRLHQLEEQHDSDYLQGVLGDALRIKLLIHLHWA